MTDRNRDTRSTSGESSSEGRDMDEQSRSGPGAGSDSMRDRTQGGYGGTSEASGSGGTGGASGSRSSPGSEAIGDDADVSTDDRLGRGAGTGGRSSEGIGDETGSTGQPSQTDPASGMESDPSPS